MRKLAALLDAAGEGGADARDELHKGETPLFAATKFGRLDAMRLLLERGASVNAVESHRETALMLSADLADGLAAAALLIEHGGRGVFPFCRRRSHSEGIGRVAETVQAYFARDVDDGKRKELTRCVSERARMAAAGEFASEDVVNAVLLEAQAKHGAKEEV